MALPVTQKTSLERHLSGMLNNSTLFQALPIAQWAVYRACSISLKSSEPSLLESLSRLGLYLATIGCTVSLLNCSIIPAISCGAVVMIFRASIIELRKHAQLTQHIHSLATLNTELTATLAQQKVQVTCLQDIINTAHITADSIRILKEQEQKNLTAYEVSRIRLETVTTMLQAQMEEFRTIGQDLRTEVSRLEHVES